ncbi:hypothetical protein RA224_12895 [Achromobacter aegrifaciens]|uniref:hypothetical protein n=1 Tax=Achromobacter aegrifaciens TaxID=1287736 RepID=UPI0027BA0DB8|nr:hypothetical protein [Achromobacter aegrifaciens]WLW64282.1 hypothetical protein RA224_12895 [Achromobacter aegrifaciens]
MKRMVACVAVASAVCINPVAGAATAPEGQVIGMGAGVDMSCADFVMAMSRSDPQDWYRVDGKEFASKTAYILAWVQGYITGSNGLRASNKQVAAKPNEIAVWLDEYCRTNPRATVWMGALSFVANN